MFCINTLHIFISNVMNVKQKFKKGNLIRFMSEEKNESKFIVRRSEDDRRNEKKKINGLKEQLEWIKRQIEYADFTDNFKLRRELHKGEIYEIDFGINVNAEFSNRHYGVVVRDSNPYDPLVMVCPIKSKKKEAHPASDIDLGYIKELNSDHPSVAIINQIRTIDKVRIFSKHAISEGNPEENKIPILEDEKMELILTAYINFIKGNLLR